MPVPEEYQSLRLLGQGAFATIYKVRHKQLGYVRAIKVSKAAVEDENDKAYQAFLKECRVLLGLGNGCHPNIVRVYQPRLSGGQALVEMDYIDGVTLADYIAKVRFVHMDEVWRFIHEIVGALAYCHADIYQFEMSAAEDHLQRDPEDASRFLIDDAKRKELIDKYGVIHNDLHSNNVMRCHYDGRFVLLDFGLSIQEGHAVKSSSRADGAPEYKAPEKWEEGAITSQTDIYSLGVLMYEILAGRVPFVYDMKITNEMKRLNDIYHGHMEEQPPAIEPLRREAFAAVNPDGKYERDYPSWLEDVILKCLAKKPEDRYVNARELLDDIERHIKADGKGDAIPSKANSEEIAKLQHRIEELNAELANMNSLLDQRDRDLAKIRDEFAKAQEELRAKPSTPNSITFKVGAANFNMIVVEGSTFQMGGTPEQGSDADKDEVPVHDVQLSSFAIGQTQVTQALWQAVMNANPSNFKGTNRPVDNVSWADCQSFVKRLCAKTGYKFCLPTEAQWEFAARGGKLSKGYIYSGSNNINEVAWHGGKDSNSDQHTHDVASLKPNELGLYDMCGNVWEWCEDKYGSYPESPQSNPTGPDTGQEVVCRGGGWQSGPVSSRITTRRGNLPGMWSNAFGLRVCIALDSTGKPIKA